jgi:hypothetical protein
MPEKESPAVNAQKPKVIRRPSNQPEQLETQNDDA